MIAYNAEPLRFSESAILAWEKKGYSYHAGNWEEIDNALCFKNVEVLIIRLARRVDSNILDKFPDLKILVSSTTGLDHIDLSAVKIRGISLVSLRGQKDFLSTIPSTAEHTWALLLSLARMIPAADLHVSKGFWERDLFRGHQIKGKIIGIIGLGRTGSKVAHFAEAFDMVIYYYDPNVTTTKYRKIAELKELLSISDFISIHVHLNDSTRHLINERNIETLKKGAFLINTSRGNILDEQAVANALSSGQLGGVAVDVLATEMDNISKSPLWQLKSKYQNIIITPHIGGATSEAMKLCEEYLANL